VRNEPARAHARSRPEPIADLDATAGCEDDRLEDVFRRAEIQEAMSHLDSRERELLDLRYGRDLTQPAIAKTLDMPEGTVKVRLHRARAKLHQALSDR
jgi:RNA polymerase sigma-70 factor, ECF subfamily